MLSRRKLLTNYLPGALAATSLVGLASLVQTESSALAETHVPQDKMLVDLQVHLSKERYTTGELAQALKSPMVVGLSSKNSNSSVFTYQDAVRLHGAYGLDITELETGRFASVHSEEGAGYILNVQEMTCGDHHVLGAGIVGKMSDYKDTRKTAREIHYRGGLAILAHPYADTSDYSIRDPAVWDHELEEICRGTRDLDGMDEIETFNAHLRDIFLPGHDFDQGNGHAASLAQRLGFKGVATTDARGISDVGLSGIVIPQPKGVLTLDHLYRCITQGDFETIERHVSIGAFVRDFGPDYLGIKL